MRKRRNHGFNAAQHYRMRAGQYRVKPPIDDPDTAWKVIQEHGRGGYKLSGSRTAYRVRLFGRQWILVYSNTMKTLVTLIPSHLWSEEECERVPLIELGGD